MVCGLALVSTRQNLDVGMGKKQEAYMKILFLGITFLLLSTNLQARPECVAPAICDDGGNSCEKAQVAYKACVEGWSQDDWSKYYSSKNSSNSRTGKSGQQ